MFHSVVKTCAFVALSAALLSTADANYLGSGPKVVQVATGTIDIGKPLASIPIPGGVRIGGIEPFPAIGL